MIQFQSETMRLHHADTVPYLTYRSFEEISFIRHAFSTRLGGVSEGEFSTMNLAFNRGDNPARVTENYRRLCQSAGFDFDSLVASAQDHHTLVRAVTAAEKGIGITKPRDLESVDALITNEPGVTPVTYYADCTPLWFVDTENRAIGLAHAGWRGTVGRIGQKVVEKMTALYGTDPANIRAAVGPAISVCCYEVDEPCAAHFFALEGLDSDRFVFPKQGGKFMVDLLEANRQILTAAGVPAENITVSDVCTNCNSDLLWSHRATKGRRGTMCAFMCIK